MPSPRRVATLVATLATIALATPAGAHAADCAGADAVPAADNLTQVGQATLCLLNAERAAQGMGAVTEASGLTQPSRAYSARMVAENFFAHESPDGGELVDRLTAVGYIAPDGDWTVGENIAWGQGDLSTPRSIVAAWMASPGHRANVLTREYTEIGLGGVLGTPGDASWGATYTTDFGAVQRNDAATVSQAVRGTSTTSAAKPAKAKARVKRARAATRCKGGSRAAAARARAKGAKGAKARKAATTCARAARRSAS
ncbi:MAG: hypothetical protein QOF29_3120 [bacterium]